MGSALWIPAYAGMTVSGMLGVTGCSGRRVLCVVLSGRVDFSFCSSDAVTQFDSKILSAIQLLLL